MKTAIQLARSKFAQVRQELILFNGGVDLVSPPFAIGTGFCQAAQNIEVNINGGYSRVDGYERFDGQPEPSEQTYAILAITLTGAIAVGNTVTGVTSAATGYVLAVVSGYLVITKITGTFVSGETLNVAAAPQATTTAAAVTDGGSTPLLHAQYKNLAADEYRDDIAAVTGSGDIFGVWRFGGVTYAWRNNAGGTAAAIYKSSSSGWTAVSLYNEITFTAGGATQPAEGTTLTQGGVTATIRRVVQTNASTTWATNTAAGRFIIENPAGGNFAAGAATIGAINVTLSGVQTAITLLPSGRYRFKNENFGGSVNTRRIYGCDGVNRGFEFDGAVFVPITTGMTADTPNQVHTHKNQLFFSFGASVQHAAPGTPYIWSAVLGASEIAMGDTVTGFQTQAGSESTGALAIFTRNRLAILYGTGVSNWNLVPYREEIGAYADTVQDIGMTMFLDDRGVTNIQASQSFGNFSSAQMSKLVRTWLNTQRTKAISSCIVRDKNQYRLFFSDSTALYVTIVGNKVAGMFQELLDHKVACICSSEESDGSETIFFGSTGGMVYRMDVGTSFDGDDIEYYGHLVWNSVKSPRTLKQFSHCMMEVYGTGYATFRFSYVLGYGTSDIDQPSQTEVTTNFASGNWDSGVYDVGVWDGQTLIPSVMDMAGDAENVSLRIAGSSDYHASIRYSGALIDYSFLRNMH